ncbi:FISUMP domain-containing protein [Elizabethkingia sp. HX QKY]|uniref:fimbrillin family protein n=1 Tax=Elizabethkingia TaxID=308865 RepID=UPI002A23B74F|nr:FISUMP domain-containing protein [Elizabethkingia sp. HX QKY]MDX8571848.1 FISUMP domain-containing protein [Elizabethkingia sp. HX QKY]
MKIRICSVIGITLLSVIFINSCRSTDTDHNITTGVLSVNINLLGTEFSNPTSSLNASLKTNVTSLPEVQTRSVLVNPSTVIVAELVPSNDLEKVSILKPMVAIPGSNLEAGMKFRVIAYRQSTGDYHTHQDYTVGQTANPMMLDNGGNYNIVVYSYGTTSLPVISMEEQNNINSATVNYDNINRDFMYQKISYTPVDDNNTLNITLRHKVAQITTIVKYTGSENITSISSSILTPHYTEGIYSLSTGTISAQTIASSESVLNFSASGSLGKVQTAFPVFVNADTGGAATGGFSANITIGGESKTINLPNSFKITPGNKSNLTINLNKCGVYLGAGNTQWSDFMCYNLGADQSIDPFTAYAIVHGDKYQWGAQTGETGRYYSQSDDHSNSGAIMGWNTIGKPNGSWSDSSKTLNDPCPSGYRVPTRTEWQNIINNNKNIERVGSWANDGNYTSALYFRDASNIRTLMLPVAGFRESVSGNLLNRGNIVLYWSSSESDASYPLGQYSYGLYISSSTLSISNVGRVSGLSVRCIAG